MITKKLIISLLKCFIPFKDIFSKNCPPCCSWRRSTRPSRRWWGRRGRWCLGQPPSSSHSWCCPAAPPCTSRTRSTVSSGCYPISRNLDSGPWWWWRAESSLLGWHMWSCRHPGAYSNQTANQSDATNHLEKIWITANFWSTPKQNQEVNTEFFCRNTFLFSELSWDFSKG